jgi:hypothetical protein
MLLSCKVRTRNEPTFKVKGVARTPDTSSPHLLICTRASQRVRVKVRVKV